MENVFEPASVIGMLLISAGIKSYLEERCDTCFMLYLIMENIF